MADDTFVGKMISVSRRYSRFDFKPFPPQKDGKQCTACEPVVTTYERMVTLRQRERFISKTCAGRESVYELAKCISSGFFEGRAFRLVGMRSTTGEISPLLAWTIFSALNMAARRLPLTSTRPRLGTGCAPTASIPLPALFKGNAATCCMAPVCWSWRCEI